MSVPTNLFTIFKQNLDLFNGCYHPCCIQFSFRRLIDQYIVLPLCCAYYSIRWKCRENVPKETSKVLSSIAMLWLLVQPRLSKYSPRLRPSRLHKNYSIRSTIHRHLHSPTEFLLWTHRLRKYCVRSWMHWIHSSQCNLLQIFNWTSGLR